MLDLNTFMISKECMSDEKILLDILEELKSLNRNIVNIYNNAEADRYYRNKNLMNGFNCG